jgi:CHASE2 domain-containing sensor protein
MGSRTTLFRFCALALILLASVPLGVAARNNRPFSAETRLSDIWFRTRRVPPREDEIIVARDEKTLQAMGAPTHADYGALIRKLKAAGAAWIVFDLDLGDRQGPAADEALWTAISDSHRTLVLVRYDATGSVLPDPDVLRGLRALEKSAHWQEFEVKPGTPEFYWLNFAPATSDFIHSAHGAGVAVTGEARDRDGVLRRSRAGYVTKVLYPADQKQGKLTNYHAVVPSLAVMAAVSKMGGDKYALDYRFGKTLTFGGKAAQPLTSNGLTPIDYAGPAGTFPRVSMVDVLRSEPMPKYFKDRIVFVGSTVANDPLSDYQPTPFGTPMPRVEITANQVQSFLNVRPLLEPHTAGLAAIVGLGLLLGLLVPAFRPLPALLAGIIGFLLYLLVGWWLFATRSLMLPLFPALLLVPSALGLTGFLGYFLHPYAVEEEFEIRDTGMAVGADESLPVPRRRWGVPRRRAGT